jgi:hypothetical protein
LVLIPSDIVGPDARTFVVDETGSREVPTVNYCYSGKLRGDDDSFVRVALMKGSLRGVVWTSTDTYILEPLGTYDPID